MADFDLLDGVFAENITIDYRGGTYRWESEGRNTIKESLRHAFHNKSASMHTAHHPEIAKYLSKTENNVQFVLFSTRLSNKRFWDFCVQVQARPVINFPFHWTVGHSVRQILQYPQCTKFKSHWFSEVFLHSCCVFSSNLRKEFRIIGWTIHSDQYLNRPSRLLEYSHYEPSAST